MGCSKTLGFHPTIAWKWKFPNGNKEFEMGHLGFTKWVIKSLKSCLENETKAQITKIGETFPTAFIIGMAGVQVLTKLGRECVER